MGFILFLINLFAITHQLGIFLVIRFVLPVFFWALKLSQLISACLAHLSPLHKARHYICPAQCCATLVAPPKFSASAYSELASVSGGNTYGDLC